MSEPVACTYSQHKIVSYCVLQTQLEHMNHAYLKQSAVFLGILNPVHRETYCDVNQKSVRSFQVNFQKIFFGSLKDSLCSQENLSFHTCTGYQGKRIISDDFPVTRAVEHLPHILLILAFAILWSKIMFGFVVPFSPNCRGP
jgi:hypothetical protein